MSKRSVRISRYTVSLALSSVNLSSHIIGFSFIIIDIIRLTAQKNVVPVISFNLLESLTMQYNFEFDISVKNEFERRV